MPPQPQLSAWCFTLNNYNDDDEQKLKSFFSQECKFGTYGRETAPTTGTRHLQGYFELKRSLRLSKVRTLVQVACHLEGRRGTRDQAIVYCQKDGDFVEVGSRESHQGNRTDLDSIRSLAADGGMRAVSRVGTHQEIKVAESYLLWNEPCRDWKPQVLWYYGATGVGKSRKARWYAESIGYCPSSVYTKCDGAKWWPGYDRHEFVIIDDFRPSWWCLTEMLSLLDRYEKKVEYKGGYRQFVPRTIVVTSALPPQNCYEATGEAINQLLRRIDEVCFFPFEWTPPIPQHESTGDRQPAQVDVQQPNSNSPGRPEGLDLGILNTPSPLLTVNRFSPF